MMAASFLLTITPIQTAIRQTILRRAGYFVIAALSPARALEQLQDEEFPRDRAGYHRPRDAGDERVEFVRELRKTRPQMPVFVISGLEEAEAEYAGLDVHFLLKPLPPDMLLARSPRPAEAAAVGAGYHLTVDSFLGFFRCDDRRV